MRCENGYVAFWNENPQIAQFQQIPKILAFPRLYLVVYLVRSFLLAGQLIVKGVFQCHCSVFLNFYHIFNVEYDLDRRGDESSIFLFLFVICFF